MDARKQLLICLRFFATGALQQLIGDSVNGHKSTVCQIVSKVTHQLVRLKQAVIKMPTQEEMIEIHKKFVAIRGFLRVIQAIDGTHIPIQFPGSVNAELYSCRKGFFL